MKLRLNIRRFLHSQDGSLLVFFMISTIAIFGIIALSFDLGRRAATQTDMQGFVDNVALAAAGELNGSPNAIVNATAAANSVIQAANERLKEGTGGQDFEIALDQIIFYSELPDRDAPPSLSPADLSNPASPSYKYNLPPSDFGGVPIPEEARFVGVRLATVDVAWMFAGIFSASDLPNEAIGAVAVAGKTAWTCDLAPLLFCLPDNGAGGPLQVLPGQAINLRSAGMSEQWQPGEFGFAAVDIDPAGACAGIADEAGRQACMLILRNRVAACFQPDRTDVIPGQRPSQESAAFEMSLDIFDQSMIQFFNDAHYAPGPHSVSGRVPAHSGEYCAPSQAATDTMAFPLDDCHPSGCIDGRFGDGDWSAGRALYTATNYSFPGASNPDVADGSFFEFPEANLTRYQYYLREIERAANGGVMNSAGHSPYNSFRYRRTDDGERGTPTPEAQDDWTSWDDFWPDTPDDFYNPIIPDMSDVYLRDAGNFDNGLPRCNRNFDLPPGPDRRVLLAGGIHCPASGDSVVGYDDDIEIVDFYRLFQLGPTEAETGLPPQFDLNVEVIERIPPENIGPYQNVVQLFR